MAPGNNGKGRGHVKDRDDKNDLWVEMSNLHDPVDVKTIPRFNIFDNEFKLDLHGNATKHYDSDIYDQGAVGSCTSNAVASAYRYALQRHGEHDFEPSRLFLYYVARTPQETIDKAGYTSEEKGAYYESLKDHPPSGLLTKDEGSEIRENIRILRKLGAPPEAKDRVNWVRNEWPYVNPVSENDWPSLPDGEEKILAHPSKKKPKSQDTIDYFPDTALAALCPPPDVFANVQKKIEFHYARPHKEDIDCWKQCLANGFPIICGIDEFKSFQDSITNSPYVVQTPKAGDELVTAHTVLIVGWDDNVLDGLEKSVGQHDPVLKGPRGCFKVQNSWGTETGDKGHGGFFYMPYGWVTLQSPARDPGIKLCDGPWVLVDRAELATGPKPSTP